jgi:hypothetical protein
VRLTSDNAQLYRLDPADNAVLRKVTTVAEASAVMFDCPLWTDTHRHSVLVYFAAHPGGAPVSPPSGPPNTISHTRWQVSGTTLADLTISPSINLDITYDGCSICFSRDNPCPFHPQAPRKPVPPGCRWHGWVQNGDAH